MANAFLISEIESSTRSTHLENFSLADFFNLDHLSLDERMDLFQQYVASLVEREALPYCRPIVSPPGPRVLVRDPATGDSREMLMFGSNNYLDFANHPRVLDAVKSAVDLYGAGMGGPPLLSGTSELHLALSRDLARLKGTEDSLIFASGYQANLGWVSALLGASDIVFFDEFSHASFYDGLKMSRAKKMAFRHNDLADLERKLKRFRSRGRTAWITVEGVYSMDGDLAPLPEIVELAKKYDLKIAIDDAHGTGVLGKTGSGTVEHFGLPAECVDVHIGTFSKALAMTGGFVAGSRRVTEYLRYFARSHMFSAALAQPVIAAISCGIRLIEEEPARRARLRENMDYLVRSLNDLGLPAQSESGIVVILVSEELDASELAGKYHHRGIFLSSVHYPAVPRDKQRIRISLMSSHQKEDLDELVRVTREIFEL